jgi:putative transposase
MIADKGYDADYLHEKVAGMGAEIVIPPKGNRKVQPPYNTDPTTSAMSSSASSSAQAVVPCSNTLRHAAGRFMGFLKIAPLAK